MIDLLKDWLPIIVSVVALFLSVNEHAQNKRQNTSIRELESHKLDFEQEKERHRKQERQTDELIMQLNSRSGIVPYFNIILCDDNIYNHRNASSNFDELQIELINVGRAAAVNIRLETFGNGGLENYARTINDDKNSYFICQYLNRYYAMPSEVVKFSFSKLIPAEDDGRIINEVEFKLRFNDLLGNTYEQKFEFTYDNYITKGFSLKNHSSVPELVRAIWD